MDYPILLRTALLAGLLGTGSVLAQSTPPVVTDAAPPPPIAAALEAARVDVQIAP